MDKYHFLSKKSLVKQDSFRNNVVKNEVYVIFDKCAPTRDEPRKLGADFAAEAEASPSPRPLTRPELKELFGTLLEAVKEMPEPEPEDDT